jgi:hypothetical protein
MCALGVDAVEADKTVFRIEDYIPVKFTDLEWRLDGYLRLSGEDRENEGHEDNVYYPGGFLSGNSDHESDSKYLRAGSLIEYRYETVPKTLNASCEVDFDYSTSSAESYSFHVDSLGGQRVSTSGRDDERIGFEFYPHIDARSYLDSDYFISSGVNIYGRYMRSPGDEHYARSSDDYVSGPYLYFRRDRNATVTKSHWWQYAHSVTLGPGWGRVYEGQFSATALYMVDELRDGGVLVRNPTQREMLDLTEIIYQYRLVHSVDKRLTKIEALDAVLDYLVDSGVIDDTGQYGSLLIQDVWDYFPRTSRRFGTIVRAGLGWEHSFDEWQLRRDGESSRLTYHHWADSVAVVDTLIDTLYSNVDRQTTRYHTNNTFLSVGVDVFRPLSSRWQLDATAELTHYLHINDTRFRDLRRFLRKVPRIVRETAPSTVRDPEGYTQLHLSGTGTYICNSRTVLQFAGAVVYDYIKGNTSIYTDDVESRGIFNYVLESNIKYRISIPTTLNAQAEYSKQSYDISDGSDSETDEKRWRLSVSISHYLF